MTKSTKIVAALGVVAGLGIAALPLGTFAATNSTNVEVELTVSSTVNIASDGNNKCSATITANETKTCVNTITYSTNNATGMTVTLKDADNDTNLKLGGTSSTDVIPTGAGAVVAGTAKWNVTGGLLNDTPTAMVPSNGTALTIASSNAPVSTSTPMTYHFAVAGDTMSGTYKDTVVYTATTK